MDSRWGWFWQLVAGGVFVGLWIIGVGYMFMHIGCDPSK